MVNSKYTTFLGALTDTLLEIGNEPEFDVTEPFTIDVEQATGRVPIRYRVMGGAYGGIWEFTIESNGRGGWRVTNHTMMARTDTA